MKAVKGLDTLDVQIAWNLMYEKVFNNIYPGHPFKIENILEIRSNRVFINSDQVRAGETNTRELRIRHYYRLTVVFEPDALRSYSKFIETGDTQHLIKIPKESRISSWAVNLIANHSWLDEYQIQEMIKCFFEKIILTYPNDRKFKYGSNLMFRPQMRVNKTGIVPKSEMRKVAHLFTHMDAETQSKYDDHVRKKLEPKIMR